MKEGEIALFREEVLRRRAERLYGQVNIALPLSWQAVGVLLLLSLLAGAVFIATAQYARVATVSGVVTLDKGVAAVLPSRPGIVSGIDVSDGQRVRAGQTLIRIRSEDELSRGGVASELIQAAIREQEARLSRQGEMLSHAASARRAKLLEQVAGLRSEIAAIASQIEDQRRLTELADRDYRNAERIAARGFLSQRELEARHATLVTRRLQLSQLEQLRVSKLSTIAEVNQEIEESTAAAQAQVAGALSNRAALVQQLTQSNLAQGYALTAPVAGTVSALTARVGQAAANGQQLMLIVPEKAVPSIELYLPPTEAGFVRVGQEVRVAIDAFPYTQFGTLEARVTAISASTITRAHENRTEAVYLVTAKPLKPWIAAFGNRQPLTPGMTLTARIVTRNRTLLEWLFEPIFAVSNR